MTTLKERRDIEWNGHYWRLNKQPNKPNWMLRKQPLKLLRMPPKPRSSARSGPSSGRMSGWSTSMPMPLKKKPKSRKPPDLSYPFVLKLLGKNEQS